MAFDNASSSRAQPKKPGDTLQFTPQYIGRRTSREEADGGGERVELGLSRADKVRFGVDWVILDRARDEPPVELHQHLIVTITKAEFQNWTRKRAFVVEGTAKIVQFTPKFLTRVDGVSLPDCRNLQKKFGRDFPDQIAADPSILAATRYSPEKQAIIVRACQREITSDYNHPHVPRVIVDNLCACGVTKMKARGLAETYDPESSPYQFFFRGSLTFLQADRFARLLDPERAAEDRPFLFIIAQFIDAKHIVISQCEIQETVWINFGVDYPDTNFSLGQLVELGVVRKIEKKTAAVGGAVNAEIGERVVLFDRETKRPGAISALAKFPSQSVEVDLDDGEHLSINPKYLRQETTQTQEWFGLTRFVEAEEAIARVLSRNTPIELSADDLAEIEWVLDHAAEVLNWPGFVPNEAQRQAVLQAFKYKFTIVTGPPGVGKTSPAVALVSAIAARLYPDNPESILGVALAGRAASVMRNAAVFWQDGYPVMTDASTIHRALQMTSIDDGEFVVFGRIDRCVLVSDESSMNATPLMAALLTHTTARHIIFVGDRHQLQPLGAGSPFRDMIASGVIPTTHLTQNYRTNCKGILALCDDILNGTISTEKLPEYLALGGVYYVPCDYQSRAFMVAEHYADLVAKGLSPGGIRVLSPHNTGTDGTRAVNIEVRKELEFPPDALVVGDILLITENDYQAACCPGYPQISQEEGGCETIFNGELCEIINVGSDFIDVKFEENCDGVRHVRLILSDGLDAASRLPDGVAFGRAMSVHKGQGSQFPAVIFPTETGNKRFGIIQKSIVYTALSRGIDMVIIIGDFDDLAHAALTPDLPRNTLLRDLLIEGSGRGAKS